MRLKLSDPLLFSKSIDMISELVLEVKIRINEFGLSIVAIDPANVSMASMRIPKTSFSEFQASDDILGVNLEDLKKILKRASKGSELIIEKDQNTMKITINAKAKRIFTLNLIEIDGQDKDFPAHLEYKSIVKIPSQELSDALDDAAIVSDSCKLSKASSSFIVESKDTNSSRIEFSEGLSIEGEDSESRYSLEYLQKFMKAGKFFTEAKLSFATDHPIRLDFNTDAISLSFLLAPRIETD